MVGTPLGIPLHPTQLYEFVVEMINFAFLFWLIKRKKFDGQIIGTYLFTYGVARFIIEYFRGDPGRGQAIAFVTNTQLVSIVMVIAAGALWIRGGKKTQLAAA
jgi:phosphatidylglycerol---prolipoprotein diacylglyceryl transferase